jgi:tetratricopeptide (TPR) repeat protein
VHVANAIRVERNDLPPAGEPFERTRGQWEAGADTDPGLLNEARVLSLEASLRRTQRRVPEAVALLDRALAMDRWDETPLLLLGKAGALVELGDYEQSISVLQGAVGQIDAEREPRQRLDRTQPAAAQSPSLLGHGSRARSYGREITPMAGQPRPRSKPSAAPTIHLEK